MRTTEYNAVNEWNEGAEPPSWYNADFWQSITPDPDDDPFSDPLPPIMNAEENSAPSDYSQEKPSD